MEGCGDSTGPDHDRDCDCNDCCVPRLRCDWCMEAIPEGAGGHISDAEAGELDLCQDCFVEAGNPQAIRAEMADTERRLGNLIRLLDLVAGGRKAS